MSADTYFQDDLPRIRAGTGWVDLRLESEVGVVLTARGYVPAIRVSRGEVLHLLLVGAASLAQPLEALRRQRGGALAGSTIRLRKVRAEQTSPYEVEW